MIMDQKHRNMKILAASLFSTSLVGPLFPNPPTRWIEDKKPSGKNRNKIKAARKQSHAARRK